MSGFSMAASSIDSGLRLQHATPDVSSLDPTVGQAR